MKPALVTGANGFLGSHLTEFLLERGWRVRCLVRETSDLRWLPRDRVELVFGEVTRPETLAPAVQGAEVVFHTAGVVRAPRPADYDRVNEFGAGNMARAAASAENRPRRLVLVSSLAAGGPSPRGHPRDENMADKPLGAYGSSKLRGETALRREAGDLPWTILRPPAVYGPRDHGLLILARLAAGGWVPPISVREQPVNVIHVRDLVRGMAAAAESPKAVGRTYYLAHPRRTSWEEIGRILAHAVGKRGRRLPVPRLVFPWVGRMSALLSRMTGKENPFPPDRVDELLAPAWTCNPNRARTELGFEAIVDLEQGLPETMAWYGEKGWV